LFGYISNGYASGSSTIKNLGVTDSYIKGEYYVGGLVGQNNERCTIRNSYFTGTIIGEGYVGGLVGTNTGIISNSYSISKVSGKLTRIIRFFKGIKYNNFGGLAGTNWGGNEIGPLYGTIDNSFYDKKISCQNDTGKGDGKTTAEMELIKQAFKAESIRSNMQEKAKEEK
jgi:hypothetical protein